MTGFSDTPLYPRMIAILLAFWLPTNSFSQDNDTPLCLYVSSYHQGYAWSDGIERGLKQSLGEHCTLVQLDMDTKRQKTTSDKLLAGQKAYELVQNLKPDVVITSDDNAAKYFIVPYLVGKDIPVVFSGINWTVEEYGFPAENVTGIVEIAPVKPMLLEGLKAIGKSQDSSTKITYLGAKTLSEVKNYNRIRTIAKKLDLNVDSILVEDFDSWKDGFQLAQDYDLIIMGSNSGIENWNTKQAVETAERLTKKLSVTNHDWMMPYSAIGYTKVAEEHGEWAAATAVAILGGVKAIDIPLVTNRRWDTWINSRLANVPNVFISDLILKSAKKY